MDCLKILLVSLALLSPTSSLSGGGPDEAGYRWLDSDSPGGPLFTWVEIGSVGTQIEMGDDDNKGPFPLGFSFNYYGTPYDSVRICSNGWLSFTSESHQFHNFHIPCPQDPNALLAPFWFDLDPSAGGAVYYYSDPTDSQFVVAWYGVPPFGGSGGYTFQAVLDDDGTVFFQYKRMQSSAGVESTSVGIEDGSGGVGLQYFYDGLPWDNLLHDSLAIKFYQLEHDVTPILVHSPLERIFPWLDVLPRVTVKNYGKNQETFRVECQISDSSTGVIVYEDSAWVADLPYLAESFVEFPSAWNPDPGTYEVSFVTLLPGDEEPANDSLQRYATCSYRAELAYDDGEPDNFRYLGGSPAVHWALAVRFSPPFPSYRVCTGSVLVDDTSPFEEVLVCPDLGGHPDVNQPYGRQEWVSAPSPGEWARAHFDTAVHTAEDIWLVAVWPLGATTPRVGEDTDPPIDNRSYYGVPGVYWNQWAAGDWIMRIEIDGRTGIEEMPNDRFSKTPACGGQEISQLFQNYPNPFTRTTTIPFHLPGSRGAEGQRGHRTQHTRRTTPRQGDAERRGRGDGETRIQNPASHLTLAVFDLGGRLIRTLLDHPSNYPSIQLPDQVVWDGSDSQGRLVPGGVYFYRLSLHDPRSERNQDFTATRKLVLLR